MRSNCPPAVLLNNHLDEEVQRILQPFHTLLTVFLSSKYRIRDNHINPNGFIFEFSGFSGLCFAFGATVYRLLKNENSGFDSNVMTNIIHYFLPAMRLLGFVTNFVLTIIHRYNNVILVLHIQRIYRSIDFSKSVDSYVLGNRITVAIILVTNGVIFTVFITMYNGFDVLNVLFDIYFVTLDVDFIYAIRILILLVRFLEEWIKSNKLIEEQAIDGEYSSKLRESHRYILLAYEMYKTTTQLM
ncbi:hypothetical protein B5X24_HaOG200738, partial [Helicoverpa armigera]